MKMLWTTIEVEDLETTLAFYKDTLGLEPVFQATPAPGVQVAMIGDGETLLEFMANNQPDHTRALPSGVSVGFEVDDIEAKQAEISTKGYQTSPIMRPATGMKFFFIQDPNGLGIQFVER